MTYDLVPDNSDNGERQLARYEPARPRRPLFARFPRLGRMTEAELIMREARLTRLRDEENFTTEVRRQGHRIFLLYNEDVAEHDAAIMADVKKRSNEAKAELIKALDKQDTKIRAEEMIEDPLEVREVQRKIDLIYGDLESLPVTPQPGSANGTKNHGKAQKEPAQKESIL